MSKFFASLGVRLIRYIFGFYLLVTIVTTSFQLWSEYNQTKSDIFNELMEIESIFNDSLVDSIWALDKSQLSSIANGIFQMEIVQGLKIVNPKAVILEEIGKVPPANSNPMPAIRSVGTIKANGTTFYQYSYDLNYTLQGKTQKISTVYVYSTDESVFQRVKHGFILLLINAFIKTIALWLIFYAVTQKLLVRPLKALEAEVQTINPNDTSSLSDHEGLKRIQKKNRHNELGTLATSFDIMRKSVLEKISIINQHNDDLERTVKLRTQELEQSNRELERLASHDPLTGIANRRQFFNSYQSAVRLAARKGDKLAVISIDLKNFKNINDDWGHKAGDAYLVEFTKRLGSVMRDSDLFARIGGDEFVAVLHDVDESSWEQAVKKLITTTDQPMSWGEYTLHLSGNFGVALFPQHATDTDDLLHFADEAMYAAKNSGREYALFCHDTNKIYRLNKLNIPYPKGT